MKKENTQLAEVRKPGKFRAVIIRIGKRNLIIAGAVVLIGVAVLMNYVLFAGGTPNGYPGYDQPGNNVSDALNQTPTDNKADAAGTFFSATQISRQKARDEALEVLQSVVDNVDAGAEVKENALAGIEAIALEIRQEANIESLITAKGFAECVAVLNGKTASIIVSADTLQPAQIAQINTIVFEQTGIEPAGVTIINK